MDTKTLPKNLKSNVIPFNKLKNKSPNKKISSTIAAIIAVNVTHPENISAEEYFIDKIDDHKSFEIVAFEDALEEIFDQNNTEVNKGSLDFINDA